MTEFENFIAQAERVWGRRIAREAARIYAEQGEAAARRFLAGFECFGPKRRRRGRSCDPIGLLDNGRINIGTPDQMRAKLEIWRRERAKFGGE